MPIDYAPLMAQMGSNAGKTVGDWIAGFGNGSNLNNGEQGGVGNRLAAAGQSVTQGYSDYSAAAQKAKALRQVVQAYAQDEPDPDKQKNIIDQSHTMGLADLEGYVQGHVANMAAQKQKADIQEQLARGGYYDALGAAKETQAEDDAGWGDLMDALPAKGSNPDGSYGVNDYINAMKGIKLSPRVQGVIAGKLLAAPKNPADIEPQEMTTPGGTRLIYSPKTGQYTLPDKGPDDLMATKPAAEDVPDGYMAMQVGKGWKIQPDPSRWQTRVETDPANPLAQIHTQVLLPKAGAGSSAVPMPQDKTKLVAATVYATPRGNAKWDGKQFQLVK